MKRNLVLDFASLVKNKPAEVPPALGELFKQLDRKTTHTSLRPAQLAALAALDLQLSERDVIMKLSTGSGKTVVGLVYAEMMRRKYKGEPVVYLCPTKQLLEQVVASGKAIGIAVESFPESGLPYSALRGDCVLVCTYDRLFNAKSVFETKSIQPSAFIMDDVHAGVDRVRKYFTAPVPSQYFSDFLKLLRPLCEQTDRATWAGIDQRHAGSTYEVPYWIWSRVSGSVAELLDAGKNEDPLVFKWGNIVRYIELARCCISGTGAEIALHIPPVEDVQAYSNAKHRLFMSASIKDISSLITALDCDQTACGRLIEPVEDEGAGERMILPISLINPESKKDEIACACQQLATQTNVVVLTSSGSQAKVWTDAGATLHKGTNVDNAIDLLRSSNGNFFVFAQRFDGVDLPDNACRILVIDGVPRGDRIIDQVDAYRQKNSPEYDVRTVNKFEQALGRAVRSSADFAAVLLVGPDVAAFIGRNDVIGLLEDRTRLQTELGRKITAAVAQAGNAIGTTIAEVTAALLSRDEGWKESHREYVKVPEKRPRVNVLTAYEHAALALRCAWLMAKSRNFQQAVTGLRDAANGDLHAIQKAELLYWVGAYLHQFDQARASEVYQSVFETNTKFPRPTQVVDRKFSKVTDQATAVCFVFRPYESTNAAIAYLDEVKAKLSFGNTADTVEQGLHEFGTLLGATSSRPEKETGRGPDVLWLFDDCGACIEAKSEKTSPVHKRDTGQLALSREWCTKQLAAGTAMPVPVFATDVTEADREEDIASETRLLTEAVLMDLVTRLRNVILSLAYQGPLFTDPLSVTRKLAEQEVHGRGIIAKFTKMKL